MPARPIIDDLAAPGSMPEAERLALREAYTQVTDGMDAGETTSNRSRRSYQRDLEKARQLHASIKRKDPLYAQTMHVNPQGRQAADYFRRVYGHE